MAVVAIAMSGVRKVGNRGAQTVSLLSVTPGKLEEIWGKNVFPSITEKFFRGHSKNKNFSQGCDQTPFGGT